MKKEWLIILFGILIILSACGDKGVVITDYGQDERTLTLTCPEGYKITGDIHDTGRGIYAFFLCKPLAKERDIVKEDAIHLIYKVSPYPPYKVTEVRVRK